LGVILGNVFENLNYKKPEQKNWAIPDAQSVPLCKKVRIKDKPHRFKCKIEGVVSEFN
jgi:hypothetical protein